MQVCHESPLMAGGQTVSYLNERSGGRYLTIEVLLPLLLLHFERETRAENSLHNAGQPILLISE